MRFFVCYRQESAMYVVCKHFLPVCTLSFLFFSQTLTEPVSSFDEV